MSQASYTDTSCEEMSTSDTPIASQASYSSSENSIRACYSSSESSTRA
ncbi:53_t:CDS:1, partial [Racocetra fulgida]